ncbi:MAG: PAS domain S-box protein [Gemmatimonadales bacterium]
MNLKMPLSRPARISLIVLSTAFLMIVFEVLKTLSIPTLTLWQSHAITIVVLTACSGVIAHFVIRRIEVLARNATRESEERFRRLSDAAFEGIAITEQGRFVDCNARLAAMLGTDTADIIGRPVLDFVAPEDADRVTQHQRSGATDRYEHVARRKDGTTLPVEVEGRTLMYQGRMLRFTALRDITERKQAEERLRQSQEMYRTLVEGVKDVIFALSVDGVLTSLNSAFEEITGFTRHEWLGKPMVGLLHPADVERARAALRAAFRNEARPMLQLHVRTRKGEYRIGEFRANPLRVEGKVIGLVGSVRDITERLELEEEFRHAQKMEAVGRLAGGVAHDFNNLLTVIHSYSQLVLDTLSPDDARRADIGQISHAAERAATLTKQLLAFSRRQVLQPTVVDLNAIVADAEKMLQRLIGDRVELVTHLQPELPAVRADVGQLEQVIMNLAVNAGDAMPDGGTLTLETAKVEIDAATHPAEPGVVPPGSYVLLRVSDTGVGMEAATQAHVFEPFFTTKEKGKGTGLGLATVYGIVKQSDGFISIESEPGRGATFNIYLPLAGAHAQPGAVQPGRHAAAGRETILLAEDEETVRRAVSDSLRKYGYEVLVASNAESALRIAAATRAPIALLVADLVMPGMSGRDLAGLLTAQRPQLKVLFVSGYADETVLEKGVLEPGLNLLLKPFAPEVLAQKVREVLAGSAGT